LSSRRQLAGLCVGWQMSGRVGTGGRGRFRGPHGVKGDFDGDASCFEGVVFTSRRLARLPVVFSVVEVTGKVAVFSLPTPSTELDSLVFSATYIADAGIRLWSLAAHQRVHVNGACRKSVCDAYVLLARTISLVLDLGSRVGPRIVCCKAFTNASGTMSPAVHGSDGGSE